MLNILCTKVNNFEDEKLCEKTLNNASSFRLKRYEEIRNNKGKLESLAGTYLLQTALLDLNFEEKFASYKTNRYGKPQITNIDSFHFNISHSGEYAVLSYSDSENGIDIQHAVGMRENIASRFFSKSENDYLNSIDESIRESEFFRIWSIKEAYIKYMGEGLRLPLSSFSIEINTQNKARINKSASLQITEINALNNYFISCVHQPEDTEFRFC